MEASGTISNAAKSMERGRSAGRKGQQREAAPPASKGVHGAVLLAGKLAEAPPQQREHHFFANSPSFPRATLSAVASLTLSAME